MAISMSALRRALAEMAEGASFGARQAYGGRHIDQGVALGGLPGAVGGGAIGVVLDDDETRRTNGAGMVAGALGGALLGGGAGGVAKLAHMAVRGAGDGAGGFSRGLREALAEQAASRGMGRRAVREAADAEDSMRFFDVRDPRSAQFLERMRARYDELANEISLSPGQRQELNELRSLLEAAESQAGRM